MHAATTDTSKTSSKLSIKISKITLDGGRIRFTDNYIKPHYRATLKNFGGTITGLSSEGNTPATLNLHGSVNNAPLIINGEINPLKGDLFLDLQAEVHGMELAPLSAYTSKYAGYGIEKGQLSFEVAYKVENRELTANNRLILNQLTFGEEAGNPDTERLPVQLAVSLLRDGDGVIDIDLPITGSLDDPEFSVGSVIGKAFVNMLGKAITSPFALLGSMFGGGSEELGWLEFEPGQYAISEASEGKLTTLAEALNNRPSLKLDVIGLGDPETDKEGLAKAGLQRKLRAMKIKNMGDKGKAMQQNKVTISSTEYPALLRQVYSNENRLNLGYLLGKKKALSVQEMEMSLLEKTKVTNDNLMALGTLRAVATKEWLVAKGKVPPARVFVLSSKLADSASDTSEGKAKFSRVEFAIKD
jgi:flagellar motor protein MotB